MDLELVAEELSGRRLQPARVDAEAAAVLAARRPGDEEGSGRRPGHRRSDLIARRRLRDVDLAGERAPRAIEQAGVDAGAVPVLAGALPGDEVRPARLACHAGRKLRAGGGGVHRAFRPDRHELRRERNERNEAPDRERRGEMGGTKKHEAPSS